MFLDSLCDDAAWLARYALNREVLLHTLALVLAISIDLPVECGLTCRLLCHCVVSFTGQANAMGTDREED